VNSFNDEGGLMRVHLPALLVAFVTLPLTAAAAPNPLPALIERARYVALGYDLGDRFLSADQISEVAAATLPEERRAMEAIRSDLEKWGRYIVTMRPEQAEIIIAVRVGRRGSLNVGTRVGNPGDGRGGARGSGTVSSRTIGGQLSSNEDRVSVYEAVGGRPGIRLWTSAGDGGLVGSPPRLYKSFREEIEASAKKP
jgi:hypothetical protein